MIWKFEGGIMNSWKPVLASAIVSIGIMISGLFLSYGYIKGNIHERYVTVKGVSEKNVSADIALWPIKFVSTDNDLTKARAILKESEKKLFEFLNNHSISNNMISIKNIMVKDKMADAYRTDTPKSRYIITETVLVRTNNPKIVVTASQDIGSLIDSGIVLSSSGEWNNGPTYLFSGLNKIKPEMIADATKKAREAAEKFASDSNSILNGIRRANQGVFVILPRDPANGISEESQPEKKVRVVSTIEYLLKSKDQEN